jgi:hypothetical protein
VIAIRITPKTEIKKTTVNILDGIITVCQPGITERKKSELKTIINKYTSANVNKAATKVRTLVLVRID